MRRALLTLLAVTVYLSAACVHTVPQVRPAVQTPEAFRGTSPEGAPADDTQWAAIFGDHTLQELITEALAGNDSLRVAAARILQAEAAVGIVSADGRPQVSAGGSASGQRLSDALGFPGRTIHPIQMQGSVAWEPDFWQRFRHATAAARAQLVATEWGRRAVQVTLVEQVTSAYVRLRMLDAARAVALRTLAARQGALDLVNTREKGGAATLLDVRQAEQLVRGAGVELMALARDTEQLENGLSLLLGRNPGPIGRPPAGETWPRPDTLPAGLPADLLERRPDLQQIERQLDAAHAQVAVAKAAFFPRLALTGLDGLQSSALTSLFSGPAAIWTVGAALVTPVVTGGRLRSQQAMAEAREQELVATYQGAVRQAFREVADALAAYRGARSIRDEQAALRVAAEQARRLAQLRYEGGATSFLEVLDADTRLFAADLGSVQAQLSEQLALVALYRALGGGWRP